MIKIQLERFKEGYANRREDEANYFNGGGIE